VDRVRVGYLGRRHQSRDIKVGFFARGRAYADSFVGKSDVEGIPVGLGIDRNRFDAKLATSSDDPQSYLATVCDQNFLKQGDLDFV
jgi:hypothetical protein